MAEMGFLVTEKAPLLQQIFRRLTRSRFPRLCYAAS